MEAYSDVFMELEFHTIIIIIIIIIIFFFFFNFDRPILDFLQIEFFIETRFWQNRVTKKEYFLN